jgi:hypothetical protein
MPLVAVCRSVWSKRAISPRPPLRLVIKDGVTVAVLGLLRLKGLL